MLLEALKLSLRSIARRGVRSALTVLGVLIGITAVVVVVALGESARKQVSAQIESLGSNLVYVFNGSPGGRGRSRRGRRLSSADARAIREHVPGLRGVTVYSSLKASVKSDYDDDRIDVVAGDEDYVTVRGYGIVAGRDITADEVRAKAKVGLIGQTARTKLFGQLDPVGRHVRIGRHRFAIVGLLSSKGETPFGTDQDDRFIIPVSTWQSRVSAESRDQVGIVIASAKSPDWVADVKQAIDRLMHERHRIGTGKPDYSLLTQDQFRQSQDEVYRVLSILLISVAAVSLFVGGVGVMNIMLVSVTERRREIGTRLAVGARGADIRLQFLSEAIVLTLLGGILGIGTSLVALELLGKNLDWQLSINLEAVAAALGTSIGLGALFGFLPAHRAARLDPIEALRHE